MPKTKNLLYVSCMCSEPMMHKLFDTAHVKPHPAPQKYHSLLVKGLVENGCQVTCLVALPVTVRSHPNKRWWQRENEMVDGVCYVYMPFYNHPLPKLLGFKIYAFFYTLMWALRTRGERAMICDVLNAHAAASMRACRITATKAVGIVTDIPGYMDFSGNKVSWLNRIGQRHAVRNIRRMTHLIPLTEAMCDIINPERKRPYVVIEGLVDSQMKDVEPIPCQDGKRHITYTGTLNAAFGVRNLVEGFMKLKNEDIVLDIYGSGSMKSEIEAYMERDTRLCYHGVVPIEEAVKAQRSSYLLVNPRPTSEEFTKFSFPSKNMEYMVSGVPLMTAVLPGMPKEYHPYVFLFKDETAEGICCCLNEILSMPEEAVRTRGRQGKAFVLENKNNIRQAKRVIELIESNGVSNN